MPLKAATIFAPKIIKYPLTECGHFDIVMLVDEARKVVAIRLAASPSRTLTDD
jgi:hypothetical protein